MLLRSNRDQPIEALRIVAAFGIVWFHAKVEGWSIAYAGLSVFIVLSIMFAAQNAERRVWPAMQKLLWPWLVWSAIYWLINSAQHDPVPEPLLALTVGPAPHLWYLPFIVGVIAITVYAVRHFGLAAIAKAASPLIFLTLVLHPMVAAELDPPWAQWAYGIAPIFAGATLAGVRSGKVGWAWALAPLAAAGAGRMLIPGAGAAQVLGIAAVAAAVAVSARELGQRLDLGPVASLMFGVYLVHPIILFLVRPLTAVAGLLGVAVAFIISMALVFGYRLLVAQARRMVGDRQRARAQIQ